MAIDCLVSSTAWRREMSRLTRKSIRFDGSLGLCVDALQRPQSGSNTTDANDHESDLNGQPDPLSNLLRKVGRSPGVICLGAACWLFYATGPGCTSRFRRLWDAAGFVLGCFGLSG